MSIDVNSIENENTLISQNEEIIKLLRAILLGIEDVTGQENLIDNIEE
jgi:hypothetical protein